MDDVKEVMQYIETHDNATVSDICQALNMSEDKVWHTLRTLHNESEIWVRVGV